MNSQTENTQIAYRGRTVTARRLVISSELPTNVDVAWETVQTSELLTFVAKGRVTFVPEAGAFPKRWTEGETVRMGVRLFGVLPFGGTHAIFFEKIDDENNVLRTIEHDRFVKVWNHTITLTESSPTTTTYEDEVVIYAGLLTVPVTFWARSFYRHRQKRWQLVHATQ